MDSLNNIHDKRNTFLDIENSLEIVPYPSVKYVLKLYLPFVKKAPNSVPLNNTGKMFLMSFLTY